MSILKVGDIVVCLADDYCEIPSGTMCPIIESDGSYIPYRLLYLGEKFWMYDYDVRLATKLEKALK